MNGVLLAININLQTSDLVKHYKDYNKSIKDKELLTIINTHHKRHLTFRTLRRIYEKKDLCRRYRIDDATLREMVSNELNTSSSLFGYRQMAEIIKLKYDINVCRERVRTMLKLLDPIGVRDRWNKVIRRRVYLSDGPGHLFHIDGNDKLKRFGFALHGAVDGFSRKILWLEVSTTNNDPIVISHYYLKLIKQIRFAPKILRTDRGTENIYCKDLQRFFTGRNDSFLYAASTHNQRIESFWSRLKRFKLTWWIDFFMQMMKLQLYNPGKVVHKELLVFCFMSVIEKELQDFKRNWNARFVRQSSAGPRGRPDILFEISQQVGATFEGSEVCDRDISVAQNVIGIISQPYFKDRDLHELLKIYVIQNHLDYVTDAEGALDLYVKLLCCLENDNIDF